MGLRVHSFIPTKQYEARAKYELVRTKFSNNGNTKCQTSGPPTIIVSVSIHALPIMQAKGKAWPRNT